MWGHTFEISLNFITTYHQINSSFFVTLLTNTSSSTRQIFIKIEKLTNYKIILINIKQYKSNLKYVSWWVTLASLKTTIHGILFFTLLGNWIPLFKTCLNVLKSSTIQLFSSKYGWFMKTSIVNYYLDVSPFTIIQNSLYFRVHLSFRLIKYDNSWF